MVKKFFLSDLVLFLFILSLGSVAFLAVYVSLAPEEARNLLSPFGIARILMVVGLSLIIYVLVRGRRKALQDQHQLGAFLDSAGEGIFAIDRKFTITLWNKAAESITGHKASNVIGRSLRDVITFYRERDRTEDIVFIEEAILYGEKKSMTEPMYLTYKNGKDVPVANSAAALLNERGVVIGCIVLFRDATVERKQNSLRSEFAYASHQLRTPVTKALWSLEAALDKPVLEKSDLQVVYAALKSIRKLSNEILEVSEIDQGIVHSKTNSIDVAETFGQALSDNEACIREHKMSVNIDNVSAGLHIQGDAHLVGRVIDELLCNAVAYSHEGGVVSVAARREDNQIVIETHDNGIGIPEEEQPLIFTKFFRGNNVDTTRSPGAGLGLYIAKGYVAAMNGKIWFKSTGTGSTFSVSLPAARDKDSKQSLA